MRSLAPFLASLAFSMLGGNRQAARALMDLAGNTAVWSRQARTILEFGDQLLELFEVQDERDFVRVWKRFQQQLMIGCMVAFLDHRHEEFSPALLAERMAGLAWGALEAAHLIYEKRFGQGESLESRKIRSEQILPIIKSLEHLSSGVPISEVFHGINDRLKMDLTTANVRQRWSQTVFGVAQSIVEQGIDLHVSIPWDMHYRHNFPGSEVDFILSELLINAKKFHDPCKTRRSIQVYWSEERQSFVVEDNGLGIRDIKAVWPDRVVDGMASGPSGVMRSGLFQVHRRLHKLSWKMTLESELGKGSRFRISPRPGDILRGKQLSSPQPSTKDSIAAASAITAPLSATVGLRLYQQGALSPASFAPLQGLLGIKG